MVNHSYNARDPISSLSHFIGAILSTVGTILLVTKSLLADTFSVRTMSSALVFGLSLIALYSASAAYHFVVADTQHLVPLRKLDHAMIYVLIAGTYTPILLNFFPHPEGVILTAAIWVIAVTGIILKLCWLNAPRWLYTSFYILMGWFILIDVRPLATLGYGALTCLISGGVFYTTGGILYILKKPNISDRFGFHELFHIFILLGSFMHYLLIFLYIV